MRTASDSVGTSIVTSLLLNQKNIMSVGIAHQEAAGKAQLLFVALAPATDQVMQAFLDPHG
jgi:hypothetical protein